MTVIKFVCLLTFFHIRCWKMSSFSQLLFVYMLRSPRKTIAALYLGVPYCVLEKMQYK